jgi:hypothetical protein
MKPYRCLRTPHAPTIDGRLDEPVWQRAPRSPRFVDMLTGEPAHFDTRAAAVWDDQALYVGFWIEEPFVSGSLTERDQPIFVDNDVEVFIDGGDAYYEFEINALGTIYEVFFIWQDAFSRFDPAEFDVHRRKASTFGGNFDRDGLNFWRGTHPRGLRWAFTDWDFPGLRSAVRIDGALNDRQTVSRGWTVELAFPWAGMAPLAHGRALPPRPGDEWRLFFGRFEHLTISGQTIHPAWSWDPIGSPDTHTPERFTPVVFDAALV